MFIDKQGGQQKDYGWWPVGFITFHEEFIREAELPKEVVYVTCIYQALDNDVVAWAMNVGQEITVETLTEYT